MIYNMTSWRLCTDCLLFPTVLLQPGCRVICGWPSPVKRSPENYIGKKEGVVISRDLNFGRVLSLKGSKNIISFLPGYHAICLPAEYRCCLPGQQCHATKKCYGCIFIIVFQFSNIRRYHRSHSSLQFTSLKLYTI